MLWRRRPNVRKLAAKGDAKRLVQALGYHDQLGDSYGRLYDLGVGVRRDAALALTSVADMGEVDVGAALIEALGDSSGEVRRAAASALGARREGRAAAALAEAALTWQDPRYEGARVAAADALIDLSGPESAEQLVRVLIDGSVNTVRGRRLLTRMLEASGEETALGTRAAAAGGLSTEDGTTAERAADGALLAREDRRRAPCGGAGRGAGRPYSGDPGARTSRRTLRQRRTRPAPVGQRRRGPRGRRCGARADRRPR